MIHRVRKAVNAILGGHAYLVGGAVRDWVINPSASPKDYDFVTPLPVEEVIALVKVAGRRVYDVGTRHGTMGFKCPVVLADGSTVFIMVEVTTFRSEVYTPGSRQPTVTFDVTDIVDELSRHDFTMNAIALSPAGHVIDPFNGRADIAQGVIRAVGIPTRRFKEDPLRILRGYRFAARFGFTVDPKTQRSMTKYAHRILECSKERWTQELDKLLTAECVESGLRQLWAGNLFKFMVPELHVQFDYDQCSPYHAFPLHEHTIRVVGACEPDADIRWAALLHDVGKPASMTRKANGQQNYIHHAAIGAELVDGIARRLKWSKARRLFVMEAVRDHLEDGSWLKLADCGAQKL